MKPKVDPEINENVFLLKKYNFKNYEINAHYVYNKQNTVFYARNGAYFKARISRSFLHDVDSEFVDEEQTTINGNTNGFTKLSLDYEKRIPINKKITGIVAATTGFIFEDDLKSDDVSFTDFGFASKYFLGGSLLTPREGSYAFPGLHEDELNVNQFIKLNLGFQFSPINNIYLTPHFNYASVGFEDFEDYIKDVFSSDGNWAEQIETSNLFSVGATASYDSYLGPVNFDVSWVNEINKIRLFFSVGLLLNVSD